MERLRAFWAASPLNKLLLTALIGLFCCFPLALFTPANELNVQAPPQAEAPTNTPAAPTDVPTAVTPTNGPLPESAENLTAEERAYGQSIMPHIAAIGQGLVRITDLFRDPQLSSAEWILQVGAGMPLPKTLIKRLCVNEHGFLMRSRSENPPNMPLHRRPLRETAGYAIGHSRAMRSGRPAGES
jgi:hypothetical protein